MGSMGDKLFKSILFLSAIITIAIVLATLSTLLYTSWPLLKRLGVSFITGTNWNPSEGHFGAFPFIAGTCLTSFMALFISLPFALSIALFLGEYFPHGKISMLIQNTTDLLAGIPSIIYGFWGLFVLAPIIQKIEIKLGVTPYGVGLLTASLILSVMIIPYAASISREVITLVPADLKEAAYAMGATRWEVIKHVILPHAFSGITAGVLLALGRAIGETMAVTMVIGNRNELPKSIFEPANTMASVIANEFAEATSGDYLSALVGIALILFLLTTIVNIIGRYAIKKLSVS